MTRKMEDSGIEWIGEIPEVWKLVPGKYLFKNKKIIVGIAEEKYERLALTLNGVIKRSKIKSDGLQPANFMTYQILDKDELVFKLIDLQNTSTSRVGISPYKGIVSPAYIILKKINEDVDAKFYYYWYYSLYLNQVFNLLGDAGVRSNINSTELLNIPVPALSYKKQKFISKELSTVENKIKNQIKLITQQIQTLEDYKKSVITEAVTKGLDKNVEMKDSGIEWIGEIPKHWEIKRLKYVMNNLNYQRVPVDASKRNNNSDILYDYYGATGVIDKIDGYTTVGRNILIGEDGANLVFRNLPLIYIADGKYWVNNHAHILHPKDGNLNYFAYQMEVIDYRNFITGAAQPKLNLENLKKVALVYPPKKEQNEIADYLDKKTATIDETISAKKKQLEIIEEYKKSLIYEYVTGKKEVEDVGII